MKPAIDSLAPINAPTSAPTDLVECYQKVRDFTEKLAAPLTAEDQCVQSMPDVSPTKWHRAHTSWFFETFILCPQKPGYKVFDPDFNYLFNSYYENVGPRHNRQERGLITRPSVQEVAEYRKYVDGQIAEFFGGEILADDPQSLLNLLILGIHHEQQHQELILMDIKHVLSCNPKMLPYLEDFALRLDGYCNTNGAAEQTSSWKSYHPSKESSVEIGYAGDGFAFDNEYPVHNVVLNDFQLASHQVTYGEWLEFMDDGGYETATLWLSDGWYTVMEEKWFAPEYVQQGDDGFKVFTLSGVKEINPADPVTHISYYEADAFARWAGVRLPTEFEWEYSAKQDMENKQNPKQLPSPVWEWTSSPYCPYPGFLPAKGAVGEYNGKFMVNQIVLRGGCWATPLEHIRPTYRNFYGPHTRWHFSGMRPAKNTGLEQK